MGQWEIGHFGVEEPQQEVWGRGEGNAKSMTTTAENPRIVEGEWSLDWIRIHGARHAKTVGARMRLPKTTTAALALAAAVK